LERWKFDMNRRMFTLATHIVTWTNWAKGSLLADYGVPAEKITVIPPGIDPEQFTSVQHAPQSQSGGPVKILFVGGDMQRKGGFLLLEAYRSLRECLPADAAELHLVTYSQVSSEPGIFVHSNLRPGDPRLVQQFATADIFVLPTEGDCLPMVLSEAGACALPLISTRVGGIPEIVIDGETGLLIEPGDRRALVGALTRLWADPALRASMGARSRQLTLEQHNAAINVPRLLRVVKDQVDIRREACANRHPDTVQEA
jgi:glycosyltransferase involved in cell wall biosynthesis